MKNDHRIKFSNWKEEAWKNQGFNGLRTHDLHEYRCDALPTELWSHTLGARSIYWVHISREEWNDVKYIWNNSYLNYGCGWKWSMITAVNLVHIFSSREALYQIYRQCHASYEFFAHSHLKSIDIPSKQKRFQWERSPQNSRFLRLFVYVTGTWNRLALNRGFIHLNNIFTTIVRALFEFQLSSADWLERIDWGICYVILAISH